MLYQTLYIFKVLSTEPIDENLLRLIDTTMELFIKNEGKPTEEEL